MSQICNKVISRQRKSWLYYNNNAFSNFREDHQIAALEKKFFINVLKHMTQFGEEKLRLLYFHATVISTRCLGKVFDATWFKQQLKPVLTNASEKERYKCLHIIIDLFNKKEIQTTNQSSSTKKEWTQAIKWLVLRIDTQEQWFTIYRKSGIEVDWIVDLFEQKAQMSLKEKRKIAFVLSDYLVGKNPQPQTDTISVKCVNFINNYLNVNWSVV